MQHSLFVEATIAHKLQVQKASGRRVPHQVPTLARNLLAAVFKPGDKRPAGPAATRTPANTCCLTSLVQTALIAGNVPHLGLGKLNDKKGLTVSACGAMFAHAVPVPQARLAIKTQHCYAQRANQISLGSESNHGTMLS